MESPWIFSTRADMWRARTRGGCRVGLIVILLLPLSPPQHIGELSLGTSSDSSLITPIDAATNEQGIDFGVTVIDVSVGNAGMRIESRGSVTSSHGKEPVILVLFCTFGFLYAVELAAAPAWPGKLAT